MAIHGHHRCVLLATLIVIVGVIHLGVGIGVVVRYRQFNEIFQQQVSLSGFNIFIGVVTIINGICAFIFLFTEIPLFSRITAITAFIVGLIAAGSLVTALVLSAQSTTYLRGSITDNMNNYASDSDSKDLVNNIQTTYSCCGVNLWLDWGRVQLSATSQTGVGRRRRQHLSNLPSPLTRALRQKRQLISTSNGVYNLPSSYSIQLPVSCCSEGGTFLQNSLGGYCVLSANNDTDSFFISGCLAPVANIAFAQIVGIAVINTCLLILAFVCFFKLIMFFKRKSVENNEQPPGNLLHQLQQQFQPQQIQPQQQFQQQQIQPQQQFHQQQIQYPYQQTYVNSYEPNSNYGYFPPTYTYYM